MFNMISTKQGEWEYQYTLKHYNYEVINVSNEPDYWDKDIDCISVNPITKNVATHEIKWDKRIAETGNLYIEIKNPRSRNGQGWFYFCEADLLAYGDAYNKVFYVIDMKQLKEYIEKNKDNLHIVSTFDGSEGYALPLENIKDLITDEIYSVI